MSLVGMDLAFKYAARHAGGALVAPPPVVALLKMVAFADRPAERERDLVDIAHLLDAYVNEEESCQLGHVAPIGPPRHDTEAAAIDRASNPAGGASA